MSSIAKNISNFILSYWRDFCTNVGQNVITFKKNPCLVIGCPLAPNRDLFFYGN